MMTTYSWKMKNLFLLLSVILYVLVIVKNDSALASIDGVDPPGLGSPPPDDPPGLGSPPPAKIRKFDFEQSFHNYAKLLLPVLDKASPFAEFKLPNYTSYEKFMAGFSRALPSDNENIFDAFYGMIVEHGELPTVSELEKIWKENGLENFTLSKDTIFGSFPSMVFFSLVHHIKEKFWLKFSRGYQANKAEEFLKLTQSIVDLSIYCHLKMNQAVESLNLNINFSLMTRAIEKINEALGNEFLKLESLPKEFSILKSALLACKKELSGKMITAFITRILCDRQSSKDTFMKFYSSVKGFPQVFNDINLPQFLTIFKALAGKNPSFGSIVKAISVMKSREFYSVEHANSLFKLFKEILEKFSGPAERKVEDVKTLPSKAANEKARIEFVRNYHTLLSACVPFFKSALQYIQKNPAEDTEDFFLTIYDFLLEPKKNIFEIEHRHVIIELYEKIFEIVENFARNQTKKLTTLSDQIIKLKNNIETLPTSTSYVDKLQLKGKEEKLRNLEKLFKQIENNSPYSIVFLIRLSILFRSDSVYPLDHLQKVWNKILAGNTTGQDVDDVKELEKMYRELIGKINPIVSKNPSENFDIKSSRFVELLLDVQSRTSTLFQTILPLFKVQMGVVHSFFPDNVYVLTGKVKEAIDSQKNISFYEKLIRVIHGIFNSNLEYYKLPSDLKEFDDMYLKFLELFKNFKLNAVSLKDGGADNLADNLMIFNELMEKYKNLNLSDFGNYKYLITLINDLIGKCQKEANKTEIRFASIFKGKDPNVFNDPKFSKLLNYLTGNHCDEVKSIVCANGLPSHNLLTSIEKIKRERHENFYNFLIETVVENGLRNLKTIQSRLIKAKNPEALTIVINASNIIEKFVNLHDNPAKFKKVVSENADLVIKNFKLQGTPADAEPVVAEPVVPKPVVPKPVAKPVVDVEDYDEGYVEGEEGEGEEQEGEEEAVIEAEVDKVATSTTTTTDATTQATSDNKPASRAWIYVVLSILLVLLAVVLGTILYYLKF